MQKGIQYKYVLYQMGPNIIVVDLGRYLGANRSEPIRTLEVGTLIIQSHQASRANSKGGAVAWLPKLQSNRKCLYTAERPRNCHNTTLYYYCKHGIWFLWGGERRYYLGKFA